MRRIRGERSFDTRGSKLVIGLLQLVRSNAIQWQIHWMLFTELVIVFANERDLDQVVSRLNQPETSLDPEMRTLASNQKSIVGFGAQEHQLSTFQRFYDYLGRLSNLCKFRRLTDRQWHSSGKPVG